MKDQNSSGGSDCAWLDNIVFPTTTTIISVEERVSNSPFTLYPNPSDGHFKMQLHAIEADEIQLNVYNTLGKLVYAKTVGSKDGALISIDLGDVNSGLYLLELSEENKMWQKKIIVR
jgi:hypothetical protein